MPNYDYQCEDCGHVEELFQSINADPLKICPQCKKETFQRKIGGGAATLRFVGSGFYKTDYSNKSEGSSGNGCCPCGKKQSCSM